MDEMQRMLELDIAGYTCSQIIIILGLEAQGMENPQLVRAMHGLAGGMGFSGGVCGALTGGVCLLSMLAGRGSDAEKENDALFQMVTDLVTWFKASFGEQYGSIDCEKILAAGAAASSRPCPGLVSQTYQKVKEILIENDIHYNPNE